MNDAETMPEPKGPMLPLWVLGDGVAEVDSSLFPEALNKTVVEMTSCEALASASTPCIVGINSADSSIVRISAGGGN